MTTDFESYIAQAIGWAQAHLGDKDYAGRCLAFVEDAYERSNQIEIFGGSTAKESAEAYAVGAAAAPPPGAFVFYDCHGVLFDEYKNWGHVGLCIGAGQVIHAWTEVRQDHYLAAPHLAPSPGWSQPRYLGWTPVATILAGHRKKEWKNMAQT